MSFGASQPVATGSNIFTTKKNMSLIFELSCLTHSLLSKYANETLKKNEEVTFCISRTFISLPGTKLPQVLLRKKASWEDWAKSGPAVKRIDALFGELNRIFFVYTLSV